MFSPLFHLHSFFHEPVSNSSSWLLVITWPTFFGYSSLLACELLFDSLGTTDFPWAFIAFKVISFPMNKTRCDSTQKSFRLVVSNHDRWFAIRNMMKHRKFTNSHSKYSATSPRNITQISMNHQRASQVS